MDENSEAQDTVSEIFKVFKSLSWELHLCDYRAISEKTMCRLRAISEKTKRQHGIPKGPRMNE